MRSRGTWFRPFSTLRAVAWCCALLLFTGAAFGVLVGAGNLSSVRGGATVVAGKITGSRNPDPVVAFAKQAPVLQPQLPQRPLWYPVAENSLTASAPLRRLVSSRYRTLRLDQDALMDALARTPLERADRVGGADVVIELPWPDGSFSRFRIASVWRESHLQRDHTRLRRRP
jgi:hypothetical protein